MRIGLYSIAVNQHDCNLYTNEIWSPDICKAGGGEQVSSAGR